MWTFQLLHSATPTLHWEVWMSQSLAITKVHTLLVWCGGCCQGKCSACVAASAGRFHGKPCLICTSIEIQKRWQITIFLLNKHPEISVPLQISSLLNNALCPKSGKMKLKIKDCRIMKVEAEEIKSISFLLKTTQLLHLTLHVHPEIKSLTIALIRAFSSIAWQYRGGK